MNRIARTIAPIAMVTLSYGCPPPAQDAPAQESAGSRRADTVAAPTRVAKALPVLGPDSLPLVPYGDAPGWYVPFGRLSPADTATSGLTPELADGANVRLFVFPPNNAWRRVQHGHTTLLFDGGQAEVKIVAADSMQQPRAGAYFLSPVDVALSPRPSGTAWLAGMWLLPRHVAGAARLSPRRTVFGDTAITWTADGLVLLVRRTSATTVELLARTAAGHLVLLRSIGIDRQADSSMGVESSATLRLSGGDDWRIPGVGAVFRLGPAGPWVFVLVESGYECSNDRLVRVDSSTARILGDEHYYECTT
jgi:hypothetical protein